MGGLTKLISECGVQDSILRNGSMWIDTSISMDFNMPEELKEYINGMDKALEDGDKMMWDYYHDVIGEFAKNCHYQGLISGEQMNAIWERYGTAG